MLRVSFSSSMRVRINHVVFLIRTWRLTYAYSYIHTPVQTASVTRLQQPTRFYRRRPFSEGGISSEIGRKGHADLRWSAVSYTQWSAIYPYHLLSLSSAVWVSWSEDNIRAQSKQLFGMTMTMTMLIASQHTARPLLLRPRLPGRKMLDALLSPLFRAPNITYLYAVRYYNPTCMDYSCPCITKPKLRATHHASRGVAAVRPGRILPC
ncbi:hypothetical protein V8C43DRAFT_160668 [Trichoderma afarasin]